MFRSCVARAAAAAIAWTLIAAVLAMPLPLQMGESYEDATSGPPFPMNHILRISYSQSPLHQDVFVALVLSQKRGGFFVEFGADDGVNLSNSKMLEQYYDWKGIVAEPSRKNHEALRRNRPEASIDTRCVWKRSGDVLRFTEAADSVYSTLTPFIDNDIRADKRRQGNMTEYEVMTVSFADLLKEHHAPSLIDYLSIDTEGSELEILESFFTSPASREYSIQVITVEHNFSRHYRKKLRKLLKSQGYVNVWVRFSGWDDYYVLKHLEEWASRLERKVPLQRRRRGKKTKFT